MRCATVELQPFILDVVTAVVWLLVGKIQLVAGVVAEPDNAAWWLVTSFCLCAWMQRGSC